MANLTSRAIIQGALVITITAGGIYYTTSDNMSPAGNGCIQYTQIDGSKKQVCGESASIILDKADQQKAKLTKKTQDAPTSTASIPQTNKSSCEAKKANGLKLGPFCTIALALDHKN